MSVQNKTDSFIKSQANLLTLAKLRTSLDVLSFQKHTLERPIENCCKLLIFFLFFFKLNITFFILVTLKAANGQVTKTHFLGLNFFFPVDVFKELQARGANLSKKCICMVSRKLSMWIARVVGAVFLSTGTSFDESHCNHFNVNSIQG